MEQRQVSKGKNSRDPMEMVADAQVQAELGDYDGALDLLRKVCSHLVARRMRTERVILLPTGTCLKSVRPLAHPQAHDLVPDNVFVMESYGFMLAEAGQSNKAKQLLRKAISLSPDTGFEKYMYLGQLLEGEEALKAMEAGAASLQRQLSSAKSDEDRQELTTNMCRALVAVAEQKLSMATDASQVGTRDVGGSSASLASPMACFALSGAGF